MICLCPDLTLGSRPYTTRPYIPDLARPALTCSHVVHTLLCALIMACMLNIACMSCADCSLH